MLPFLPLLKHFRDTTPNPIRLLPTAYTAWPWQ
mgnify:CR=1 FL=1